MVEAAFGSLVACGFSLDEILSWSWMRIFQSAKAVTVYHASVVNALAQPLLQAMETGLKGARPTPSNRRRQRRQREPVEEGKTDATVVGEESAKLAGLAGLGIPISTTGGVRLGPGDLFGSLGVDKPGG